MQGLLAVVYRSAEDDKAIIDKPVHECSMLIPGVLVPDLTGGVPGRAVNQPHREIGHGRSVPTATDTRPSPWHPRQSERPVMLPVVRRGGSCSCWDRARWSWQGEPGVEPQVLAVPAGGLVEGFDLWGGQGTVGPQVELHVVAGDGAPHRGQELCVDQGHPGRGLPGAWHVAGGVEHPAGVLVAAVCLVEDLEKVACGLLRSAGGFPGAVPEGAAVVLERVEPVTHLPQAGAHVGEGERRPVGEVPFGGRAVPGEVAQGELGQGPRSARAGAVPARARP